MSELSDEEFKRVLDRAVEIDSEKDFLHYSELYQNVNSVELLESVAAEVGISTQALDEAINEVEAEAEAEANVDESKIDPKRNVSRVADFGLKALFAGSLATWAILFSFDYGISIVFNINYAKLANQVEPRIEAAANASSLEIASSEIDQALQVLDQNSIVLNSLSDNSPSPPFGSMPKDEDIVSLYQNIAVINRQLKAVDNDITEAEREKLNRKLDQLSEYYQPEALLNSEIYQNAKSKVEFFIFLAVLSVMLIGILYIAIFQIAYVRGGF